MHRVAPVLLSASGLLLASVSVATQAPVSAPAAQTSSPAPRAIMVDDLSKMRDVDDPQISPDGKWVAYVVRSSDVEKDKRSTDIWMVSWDGADQVQLTSSPESESKPRWSPDGRFLAFLATRGDDDEKKKGAQVWLLNRAGGEAQKLTDQKGGVSDFAWSPDSTRLVLAADDPDPDDEPEKKPGWMRKTPPPLVITRYHFKEDSDGYLGEERTHLYLFDVAKKTAEQLTSGGFDDQLPTWSPDGRAIAFVSNRHPDPDRTTDTNIYVIDARAGAEPRQVTTFEGPDGGHPAWSPDGTSLAYLQGDVDRLYAYSQNKLAVIPVTGGTPRLLTAALDRSVSEPQWTRDGGALLVRVEDDRREYLAQVPASGGAPRPLTSGDRVISDFAQSAGGAVAVLSSTDHEPAEVHALENGQLRRLTKQNDSWLQGIALGETEDISCTAKDGTEVHALLTRPANAPTGSTLPLVLLIHGGPNGQDDHSFDFSRELIAAHGYAVLQVNYRGSSGRGAAYQRAIAGDWGNKEVVDLLAAVDKVVSMGVADPERLGLGGWSYGGILTNYTIATDQRFKAAVSGASSSLQTSMYGLDQYIVQYDTEMGQPWKQPDVWMKVSYPFFHADRIHTPTLFLGGDKDFNVPLAGVEQMYQALKSMGVDTELIIYPGQHHGLRIPSYQRDRLQRYLAWWDKYLKASPVKTTR